MSVLTSLTNVSSIAPSVILLTNTANNGTVITTTPSGNSKPLNSADGVTGVGYGGIVEEDSITLSLEEV